MDHGAIFGHGAGGGARHEFGRRDVRPVITYTDTAGSRIFSIRPFVLIGTLSLSLALLLSGIGAAGYIAFRDDILDAAYSRQVRMEQSYEDRIAVLRSEIDRINSRQLLDQEAFEGKIERLIARQDELKQQDSRVLALIGKARQQGVQLPTPVDMQPTGVLQPSGTPSIITAPPLQLPAGPRPLDGTPLRSSWLDRIIGKPAPVASLPAQRIAAVEAELDSIASRQVQMIAAVTGLAETNSRAIEKVVGKLGLRVAATDVPQTTAKAVPTKPGIGGPFVPLIDSGQILTHAENALARLGQLKRSLGTLPIGQPVRGPIEITSSFGERTDPFLGVMAMHTGIDFRAASGDPVVATAAGVVIEAGRQGGYGNMVEIDHGNGITTRYGHLSHFAVVAGQKIKAGQVIGYAGTTGRSTAPHLHYETRLSGEPVNPTSYLEAGNRLRPLLN